MSYVIKQELCSACHRCRTGCPVQAITFRNAKYWIDPEKCINCGKCAKVCHNGCISNPEKPEPKMPPHDRLEKTCDVCVIGGGGAGLLAAAKCLDEGKKVIVLEKMHEVGGSSWYAGGFRSHWSREHSALGLKDEREAKYQEFLEKVEYNVDPALLRRMFQANEEFVDWLLEKHGFGEDYQLVLGRMGPGPETGIWHARKAWYDADKRIDRMIGPGEIGSYMALHLQEDILKAGGEILLKTRGVKLLTDESGAVTGVLAADEGGEIAISCRAVIVATGAFSRNKELMNRFQPLFYDDEGKEKIHIFTGAGATGDGILMCEELGADIDFKNRRVNMFGPMRHPYPCASMAVYQNRDGLEVGSRGNKFFSPMGIEVSRLTEDPKWHGWKIVDDAICETAIAEAMEEPPQSENMDLPKFQRNWRQVFAEEEAAGAIVRADSLEELAEKCGFDRGLFLANVAEYNEECRHPKPLPDDLPEFMRPKHAQMPLAKGPFYAIMCKMFHENSIGGMTIDASARVLRGGQPIPGLYAAGDTTRGIMVAGDIGVDYLEGVFTSLTQAYCEGYIAAAAAVDYCK